MKDIRFAFWHCSYITKDYNMFDLYTLDLYTLDLYTLNLYTHWICTEMKTLIVRCSKYWMLFMFNKSKDTIFHKGYIFVLICFEVSSLKLCRLWFLSNIYHTYICMNWRSFGCSWLYLIQIYKNIDGLKRFITADIWD